MSLRCTKHQQMSSAYFMRIYIYQVSRSRTASRPVLHVINEYHLDSFNIGSFSMTKTLVTSALPYINGIKHLGNLIGSLLPADVYTRYLRQSGEEVLFVCGTDEHGTPAEVAAYEHQLPVQAYCASMYASQRIVFEQLGIRCDVFGRSSEVENHLLTQSIFTQLDEAGFIEERSIQQMYSNTEKRFLPDRYVTGTCPACGYTSARGDQCESCNRLLDPSELIEPRSTLTGGTDLEVREENHLFLRLDALQDQVADWIKTRSNWSRLTQGIAQKWLKEGLKARCITRDLEWGVPVPKSGYEDKVFYVWFDAPIAYISMTQAWAKSLNDDDAWKDWWMPEDPNSVNYVQFMAKDNVPFHAIFWPSMLIGDGRNWKQVDYIKSFNWLLYDGGKFSTSQKRGVFLDQALELYPADYWRYALLANPPESGDADFTFEQFAQLINKDLNDTLGNFVSRSVALVHRYFDGQVPEADQTCPEVFSLAERCQTHCESIDRALSRLEFRQATQALRALWVEGNEFITAKQPWIQAKSDLNDAATTLVACLHLIKTFAHASASFMPDTAQRLMHAVGCDTRADEVALLKAVDFHALPAGHQIPEKQQLFSKVDDDQVTSLTERFAGMN